MKVLKSYKFIVFFTILLILILDQWSKIHIKANYYLYEHISDYGFFEILFIENPGMAFGLEFGGVYGKILLSSIRVIAIFVIALAITNLIRQKANKTLVWVACLIFAGALGNLLDSIYFGLIFSESTVSVAEFMPEGGGYAPMFMGKVVDMIHFTLEWPEWMPFVGGNEVFPPVFNIADMSVSLGVIVLIIWYQKLLGEKIKLDKTLLQWSPKKTTEPAVNNV